IQLPLNRLSAPQVYCNDLIGLTNFGSMTFLQMKENPNSSRYFTDIA
uniref:Uncharacterized protein n=1 Tax=Acrobeloides nanus TaxID=290746 RepID=A0A914D8G5_9BILA